MNEHSSDAGADLSAGEMDFGALLDARGDAVRTDFEVGEKVRGVVTAIDSQSVFVDVGAKSEGVLDVSEFLDDEGRPTVRVGDEVEAYCIDVQGGTVRLAKRLAGPALDRSLQDAWRTGIPVEGHVESVRKGGFEVRIGGRRAFCPLSQIDIHKDDPETYVGRTFQFLITDFEEGGRNMVVSRRRLLEREREQRAETLRRNLKVGDMVTGRVTRIAPFGVFVDLDGVDGLIPMRELSWDRIERPEDVVHLDQTVTAVVIDLDWERERITLSLRAVAGDPWETVGERYEAGTTLTGTVTRIKPFGAFVRLEPGVEGLVHVSKLGAGPRVKHPGEVLSEGDEVEVIVERVDPEQRRISLTMEGTIGRTGQHVDASEAGTTEGLEAGKEIEAEVESIADFGVFMRLPDGRTGLLHVSEIDMSRGSTNRRRALYKRFPPGSTHTVVIREFRGDRIALTLPETLEREAADKEILDYRNTDDGKFGNLGDLLDGLKL